MVEIDAEMVNNQKENPPLILPSENKSKNPLIEDWKYSYFHTNFQNVWHLVEWYFGSFKSKTFEVFLSKTFRKLWCISLEIRGRGVKQAIKVFHTRHHLPLSLSAATLQIKYFNIYGVSQKRVTFIMLLEPRCIRSITSSRHPSQPDFDEPVSGNCNFHY